MKGNYKLENCIKSLAKDKIMLGEFADLIEQCTYGNLIVDVRNRNGGAPLSEIHTLQSYPARKVNRS